MTTKLVFAPNNRSGGFVANRISVSKGHIIESIQIKKLDDYRSQKDIPVGFIKIDVEGFEESVLEGGSRIIADQKPVVVLELNHWCLNVFQRITVPDFFDFLRSKFPLLYAVNFDGTYADLYDENDSYKVMYEHINHFNFSNLIGAFNESQLAEFKCSFQKV